MTTKHYMIYVNKSKYTPYGNIIKKDKLHIIVDSVSRFVYPIHLPSDDKNEENETS